MRKLLVVVPMAMLALGGSTACATKKFVRTSVGEVNDKVDSVGKSLEATQERTRQNEARIAEVDQKTGEGGQAAQAAHTAANQAANAATQANGTANAAGAKADAVDKASK